MRSTSITRKTKETDIAIELNLDGTGRADIHSGNGFFDHMLELMTSHGRLDLTVKCNGDVNVDFHHSAEDIGIVFGDALKQALGDKRGIYRYGDIVLPMDESLVLCAADLSGRSFLAYDVPLPATKICDNAEAVPAIVGSFDTELVQEFFWAVVRASGMTLHIKKLDGTNTHHILEAVFKAFGRVLRHAVAVDATCADAIPSTKGVL